MRVLTCHYCRTDRGREQRCQDVRLLISAAGLLRPRCVSREGEDVPERAVPFPSLPGRGRELALAGSPSQLCKAPVTSSACTVKWRDIAAQADGIGPTALRVRDPFVEDILRCAPGGA